MTLNDIEIVLDDEDRRQSALSIGEYLWSKSALPIQKENEAPFGPETRGGGNGEEVSPPYWIRDLGDRHEFSQRGPGGAPAENGFIVI